MAQDHFEFELSIESLDDGQFAVSVTASPAGTASVTVANPFTPEEINRIVGMLDGSANASRVEEMRAARAFGETLFNTFIAGPVATAYLDSLQQAGNRGLWIKLNLENAGICEVWPWELLRDPRTDFLAFSRVTPVVRSFSRASPRPLVDVGLPLRALVLIANPSDQPSFDALAEWELLQDSTLELRERGLLALEKLENAQLITLQRKLREGKPYQIFHYIGTPIGEDVLRPGLLALEDPRKKTTLPQSPEALARELGEENSIRLVVLTNAQTARQEVSRPYARVAANLVEGGIPAVVGMQYTISNETSKLFTQEFYRLLAEGYSLETAIGGARHAINTTLSSTEWASPVLTTATPSGILFPRRRSYEGRASRGGLRERLNARALATVLAAALVIAGLLLGLSLLRPLPQKRADLKIERMTIFPARPNPGEKVSITLRIRNLGSDPTGTFKWSIYNQDPEALDTPGGQPPQPILQGEEQNIDPNSVFVAKTEFTFGGWGDFRMFAFVEPNESVIDPLLGNRASQSVRTNLLANFVIDFQHLPSGLEVFEPLNLSGNEFDAWAVRLEPLIDTRTPAECKDAITRINIELTDFEEIHQLVTGKPGNPAFCTNLPVKITLLRPVGDAQVIGATIQFRPTIQGNYTARLLAQDGTQLSSVTLRVTSQQINAGELVSLNIVPDPRTGVTTLTNTTIVFSVPANAATEIRTLTLIPETSNPTPTPAP